MCNPSPNLELKLRIRNGYPRLTQPESHTYSNHEICEITGHSSVCISQSAQNTRGRAFGMTVMDRTRPIVFARPEPARIKLSNGTTGYVLADALKALSWIAHKPETMRRAVNRIKKRVPELSNHIFLDYHADWNERAGRRKNLVDFEGMQILVRHLPAHMAAAHRKAAMGIMRRVKEGDPYILRQLIRNTNNTSDLAEICEAVNARLKQLQQ